MFHITINFVVFLKKNQFYFVKRKVFAIFADEKVRRLEGLGGYEVSK